PRFCLELRRVHAPAAAAQLYRMLQVQHLVIHDVIEYVRGHRRMVEDAADDDGIVRRIVVPENPACLGLAPTHAGSCHEAVKEPGVEVFEDRLEVVKVSARGAEELASTHLPDQMSLADDLVAADVLSVTCRIAAINGLA